MANRKIAKKDRYRVKAECLRLMLTLKLNPAKMRLITGYVDTYLRLTAQEQKQFLETLVRIAPESEEKIMPLMTNSEELGWQRGKAEGRQEGHQEGRQEGRQEGIEEGLQRGLQKGIQSVTLSLLEKRVGPIDEATRNYITLLPLADLENLSLALLDFASSSDLQRWFDQQPAH